MSHSETDRPQPAGDEAYAASVITVSDRCSRGEREDASGPALVGLLVKRGYRVVSMSVVPDERPQIEAAIKEAAAGDVALVLTTGGTGFSSRDVTPEATCAVCERMAPGIPEAMRAASMAITPHACLSRETAGILGRTLVVNLPGSPKAACENISAVIGPIAHGLRILRSGPADCAAEAARPGGARG
ncbi:MogA/MoaB family molybdenum cofactor biosynthesis protein [Tractidigestivibacter sp.]|uniref:MogA/MoaB family molybdenum cofactor biosynthesis protein n=1 Tax=Tractidigestivibacter sp. TaxID=2847320 RepID=UPI002A90C67F|nr:MogA/MoaB family molybdenum cofactor biosynthesis protein [Tractidigestivibacter sp.]MDY5270637.1 MogA/MoaB family molybdenum cofactor biosynthesis protein [Tractidigestivibacter sp.]